MTEVLPQRSAVGCLLLHVLVAKEAEPNYLLMKSMIQLRPMKVWRGLTISYIPRKLVKREKCSDEIMVPLGAITPAQRCALAQSRDIFLSQSKVLTRKHS